MLYHRDGAMRVDGNYGSAKSYGSTVTVAAGLS